MYLYLSAIYLFLTKEISGSLELIFKDIIPKGDFQVSKYLIILVKRFIF